MKREIWSVHQRGPLSFEPGQARHDPPETHSRRQIPLVAADTQAQRHRLRTGPESLLDGSVARTITSSDRKRLKTGDIPPNVCFDELEGDASPK